MPKVTQQEFKLRWVPSQTWDFVQDISWHLPFNREVPCGGGGGMFDPTQALFVAQDLLRGN